MSNPEFLSSFSSSEKILALKEELRTYVASMPKELRDECINGVDKENIETLKKLVAIIKWAEGYVSMTGEGGETNHKEMHGKLAAWIEKITEVELAEE